MFGPEPKAGHLLIKLPVCTSDQTNDVVYFSTANFGQVDQGFTFAVLICAISDVLRFPPSITKAPVQLCALRACIGHGQNSGARVFEGEVLILKLLAVDGLAPRSIA